MANWGRTSAASPDASGALNSIFRMMGGTSPNTDGMTLDSVSIIAAGTNITVRVAVYQGGAGADDPIGATLVEDLGTLVINGTEQAFTKNSTTNPALTKNALTWIAMKTPNPGPTQSWYTSSAGAGDFQTARGRAAITGATGGTDPAQAFPATLDGTDAFGSFWYPWYLTYSVGGSAAITGTLATPPIVRADIVDGGKTIIATLTGDTWVASGATFDAQRSAIIQGLDAASSPANGWNSVVRDTMAVTAVVRTSDTVVTITLPAFPTYAPAAAETITFTIPASALTLATPIVATPTIATVVGPLLSAYSGITNGSGVLTFTLTSDDPLTANGEVLVITATSGSATSRTTVRPATP